MKKHFFLYLICISLSVSTSIIVASIVKTDTNTNLKNKTNIYFFDSVNNDFVPEFSENNLMLVLTVLGVKEPEIVFRQAYLETGGFTSKIFLENHNLFGMKLPYKRKTTALGKKRGHAYYSNWVDSVRDMILYQKYYQNAIKRSYNYYSFLENRYAEDPKYINKLKSLKINNAYY